jgi:cholesterol oxidase
MSEATCDFEAVVIGSGFGGAISCCRLAQRWPGKVLLLERGRRYPMGSFPRTPKDMSQNFWNYEPGKGGGPKHVRDDKLIGMFDIRNFEHMDSVTCAGYGGGSLIYANVFLEPPEAVFAQGWPSGMDRATLAPYYAVAREVLAARPVPDWTPGNANDPRRIERTEVFERVAQETGRVSKRADVCVFFGNDSKVPLPIGQQDLNRYGARQTSCTYCAECDVGCNTHSKNTVDLNYLHVAEHQHGAQIRTERMATSICPLALRNGALVPDPAATGEHGYQVRVRNVISDKDEVVTAQRVVVSAGTLNSNELLLRARDRDKTLPRLSQCLGQRFSGNGDFLSFVVQGEFPSSPNYGPVITQYTDHNLYADFQRDRAFLLEDAGYPAFASWYIDAQPGNALHGLGRALGTALTHIRNLIPGIGTGNLGPLLKDFLSADLNATSEVLLCMGLDAGDGCLTLSEEGDVNLHWPQQNSMALYEEILASGREFSALVGGKKFIPLPTWFWPLRNNVTVHCLGGCTLANGPDNGVTHGNPTDPSQRGEAFDYRGLYVADGSLLPTAVGANPIATISAVSEWVAEGITGIRPHADLR